ncbi:unnamed protein product, partial [Nesidiocoris tenuis]
MFPFTDDCSSCRLPGLVMNLLSFHKWTTQPLANKIHCGNRERATCGTLPCRMVDGHWPFFTLLTVDGTPE